MQTWFDARAKLHELHRTVSGDTLQLSALPDSDLQKIAKATGMNLVLLKSCLADKNLLKNNLDRKAQAHADRVPFFVLGDDAWTGLLSKEELRERIAKAVQQ